MCSIHLTPRCRRPVKGQVSLSRLVIDADGVEFVLPSRHFRTDSAVNSRAVYATDRRANARGLWRASFNQSATTPAGHNSHLAGQ